MPSPFPGMNPFLEQEDAWNDFHERFIPAAAEEIGKQVEPAYIVKIEQNVYVHEILERESFLEIRDRAGRTLVSAVELLSRSNKRSGPDRQQYLNKRRQYSESGVHLVEIDLLRGGPRAPPFGFPPCGYYVVLFRGDDRPAEFWPIRLRAPLPTIPIPLHAGDADARLDLQSLLHRVYDAAGYRHYIYNSLPDPPLTNEDAEWAERLLHSHH